MNLEAYLEANKGFLDPNGGGHNLILWDLIDNPQIIGIDREARHYPEVELIKRNKEIGRPDLIFLTYRQMIIIEAKYTEIELVKSQKKRSRRQLKRAKNFFSSNFDIDHLDIITIGAFRKKQEPIRFYYPEIESENANMEVEYTPRILIA